MIDWQQVTAGAVAVLGLSVMLASVSFHRWRARVSRRGTGDEYKAPGPQFEIAAGLALMCVGLGLSTEDRVQHVGWLLLAAAGGVLSLWAIIVWIRTRG